MKDIVLDCIVVRATPGGFLPACVAQALAMAVEKDCRVVLVHNDRRYLCDPKKALDTVTEEARTDAARAN